LGEMDMPHLHACADPNKCTEFCQVRAGAQVRCRGGDRGKARAGWLRGLENRGGAANVWTALAGWGGREECDGTGVDANRDPKEAKASARAFAVLQPRGSPFLGGSTPVKTSRMIEGSGEFRPGGSSEMMRARDSLRSWRSWR